MNPDKCNAPHPHIASFFCDQPRDHDRDHACWDNSSHRIVWPNWNRRRGEGFHFVECDGVFDGPIDPEIAKAAIEELQAAAIRANIKRGHP